jgi:hypothetical protein
VRLLMVLVNALRGKIHTCLLQSYLTSTAESTEYLKRRDRLPNVNFINISPRFVTGMNCGYIVLVFKHNTIHHWTINGQQHTKELDQILIEIKTNLMHTHY